MPDGSTLALFVVAALALLVVPGPAVIYIVARAIDQGRAAGMVSALGVEAGSLVHVAAAALGLSALLASSATAFAAVKYLGAAYLLYLGMRTLLSRAPDQTPEVRAPRSLGRVFGQGVVVQVLNPKVALFFLAFIPQFVDPARGPVVGQTLLFGGLLVLLGVLTDGAYALLAGAAGGWLKGNARFLRGQRYAAGSVYLGLGVATALTGSERK
jgi:threonine/homoserine/homoserine lactone efflux protein